MLNQIEQNTIASFVNVKTDMTHVKTDIITITSHLQYLYQKMHALENQLQATQKKKTFVASTHGKKVHSTECLFAKQIRADRKLSFVSKEIAHTQGFTACLCVL